MSQVSDQPTRVRLNADQCGEGSSLLVDGGVTTFLNPYSYRKLRKTRPGYLNDRSLNLRYDGVSMVILARVFGGRRGGRESFDDTSLAPRVFSLCEKKGLSLALVGSAPGISARAAELLSLSYPQLQVVFVSDGYFGSHSRDVALSRSAQANIVICSMGTPFQEDFLVDLRKIGWEGAGFTCGGYLDQLVASKGKAYYPKWADALCLRWLYRIFREPRRLLPRYCVDYPIGAALFAFDQMSGRVRA